MKSVFNTRCRVLKIIFTGIFIIFFIRLFDLQILQYDEFKKEANAQHQQKFIFPARRGKILVKKNKFSNELTPLATNNTLKMLYIDPLILNYPKFDPNKSLDTQEKGDPVLAAKLLAPILINARCEKIEGCIIETDESKWSQTKRMAILAYQKELEKKFLELERNRIILIQNIAETQIEIIKSLNLSGISLEYGDVIANPKNIFDKNTTAKKLAPLLGMREKDIKKLLSRKVKRYIEITDKIVPEVSEKILELKKDPRYKKILRGVQLKDEHWRYYPEKKLASQLLGFLDGKKNGKYGIEGRFDHELRGKEGFILGATNTRGQSIIGKNADITRARDGVDIVLSIDRIIQGNIEKILEEDVKKFDADFGQIIVVEPKTGKILAMANFPTFDPNEYQKAFLRYEVDPETVQADREDPDFNQRIPSVYNEKQNKYFRYFNTWGPEVFRNKIVTDLYEPGSVMKAITVAAALNSDEITPQTTFDDTGPVEVDEFKIRNADEIYAGKTTMIEVINRSLNTGIAFIAQKMGAKLLYEYLKNFGFGELTYIELDGELPGKLEFWQNWEASELVTRGFGQGLTATPLQMVMAFCTLANGGYLMKPIFIEAIHYPDGKKKEFSPEIMRRVISEKTSHKIKAMLLNSVNNGIARGARVFGHSVMGKTGTSQTYKNGKVLSGEGTTITSFAGFGPFDDPQFVILVKYDYPKLSQWGSETAAITFKRVAKFLFSYLNIPPDK